MGVQGGQSVGVGWLYRPVVHGPCRVLTGCKRPPQPIAAWGALHCSGRGREGQEQTGVPLTCLR